MSENITIVNIPFKDWLWRETENKIWLLISLVYSLIAFTILKLYFPFPNFIPDSYSYLRAASINLGINKWPIGYSSFLRFLSCFSHSDKLLVFIQYLLLQASICYFLFTIRYFLSPGKWLFRVLFIVSIANPLSPLVANFVSSDTLFAAVSLVWLTQMLWILYSPKISLVISHVFIAVYALMVRYNALYYPLASFALILLARIRIGKKLIAVGSLAFLLGCFILFTMSEYRKLTGIAQFSAFGGWQLASNALFAYAHSEPDDPKNLPESLRSLQRIVNHHMDSLHHLKTRPDQQLGIYYLWDERAPLKEYLHERWRNDQTADEFRQWASMSPIYSKYGNWVIRHHPVDFLGHYIWPNMINYYTPNVEFLDIYNMGQDSVDDIARLWFFLKTNRVHVGNKNISFVRFYPILLALINLLFVLCFLCFWILDGWHISIPNFSKALSWIFFIWLTNFCFSVLASPIVLRYQIFPMIFTTVFLGLLLEFIIQRSKPTFTSFENSNTKYENRNHFIAAGYYSRLQQQ